MSCNIMKEYVDFSKKCINNYLKMIMGKHYEQSIVDVLLNTYIDVRYYDMYEKKYKKMFNNIGYHLIQVTSKLSIKDENTAEDKIRIKNTFSAFTYILYFDNVADCHSAKKTIQEIDKFRREKLNIVEEDFQEKFFELLRKDLNAKKEFINNLDTKDFNIIFTKTNIDNVYFITLEQYLKFPKIYSKYSIDKAFVSKDINEQKLFVIYPMTIKKILTNVIKGNFNDEYIVEYVTSIHSKEKKIKRLYNMIDDNIVKEKLIIKISYSDYLTYKEQFYEYMRNGFQYAVILDDKFILKPDDLKLLSIFKYIIVDKNYIYYEDLKSLDNVIIRR